MKKPKRTLYILIVSVVVLNTLFFALLTWLTVFGYLLIVIPLYLYIAVRIMICVAKIYYQERRIVLSAIIPVFCCFLSFASFYEEHRFVVLRPYMEWMAVQVANRINEHPPSTGKIPLPPNYIFLSRRGYVGYQINDRKIDIVFINAFPTFEGKTYYIYQTGIEIATSHLYGKNLQPDKQENTPIIKNWFYSNMDNADWH